MKQTLNTKQRFNNDIAQAYLSNACCLVIFHLRYIISWSDPLLGPKSLLFSLFQFDPLPFGWKFTKSKLSYKKVSRSIHLSVSCGIFSQFFCQQCSGSGSSSPPSKEQSDSDQPVQQDIEWLDFRIKPQKIFKICGLVGRLNTIINTITIIIVTEEYKQVSSSYSKL